MPHSPASRASRSSITLSQPGCSEELLPPTAVSNRNGHDTNDAIQARSLRDSDIWRSPLFSMSTTSWHLPFHPFGVYIARRCVSALLSTVEQEKATEDAILVTSELVANAITYGAAPVSLLCHVTSSDSQAPLVRIEVTDSGTQWNEQLQFGKPGPLEACSGRGLLLVKQLSLDCGRITTPHRNTVWADLALRSDPAANMKPQSA